MPEKAAPGADKLMFRIDPGMTCATRSIVLRSRPSFAGARAKPSSRLAQDGSLVSRQPDVVAADPRGNLSRSTVGNRRLTRNDVNIVADQWGAAINALDIAEALIATARRPVAEPADARLYGAFDATGSISTSWTGFAAAKFAQAVMHGRRTIDVSRFSAARYPTPAARRAD